MKLTNAAADQIAPWVCNLVELAAALHNLHSALWHSAEAEGISLQDSHNNKILIRAALQARHQHA